MDWQEGYWGTFDRGEPVALDMANIFCDFGCWKPMIVCMYDG